MSTDGTSDVPIYVLPGAEGRDALTSELSLTPFISPSPSSEPRVRQLTLKDGTSAKTHFEESPRSLPPALRYDTRGLELFERLTQLEDEYYVCSCEKTLLMTHMKGIASHIPDGASIVELGCGSMAKTAIILDFLRSVAKKRNLKFYALDIDGIFLKRSLEKLKEDEKRKNVPSEHAVTYAGILGSYDQAVEFLPQIPGPRVLLWMGTSMGNMTRHEATDLLSRYRKALDVNDMFFIGIDKKNDPRVIARAYNDSQGIAAELGMNGLHRLNGILGGKAFAMENFERWAAYSVEFGRLEAYVKSLADQTVTIPPPFSGHATHSTAVFLKKNELILYMYSFKYSVDDLRSLAASAEMALVDLWSDPKDMFYFCLFQKTQAEE